jgi:hypothetical protein
MLTITGVGIKMKTYLDNLLKVVTLIEYPIF